MGVTSGFFNSNNGDRTYDAEQFSSIFDGIIRDGVFKAVDEGLKVTPNTNIFGVNVGTGRAWFNHTWTLNDSAYILEIASAENLYNRIDAIVLEVNVAPLVRKNYIKVIKGTPASTPSKPALTNAGNVHQYPLAYVTVQANSTSIIANDIEDARGSSACPWVQSPVYEANNTQIENVTVSLQRIENLISDGIGDQVTYSYDADTHTLDITTYVAANS